jgi:hypothetical protein
MNLRIVKIIDSTLDKLMNGARDYSMYQFYSGIYFAFQIFFCFILKTFGELEWWSIQGGMLNHVKNKRMGGAEEQTCTQKNYSSLWGYQ